MKKAISLFSNGTEFMHWRSYNCDICKKDCEVINNEYKTNCEIEEAIAFAAASDGTVTEEIANRTGYELNGWKCKEFGGLI